MDLSIFFAEFLGTFIFVLSVLATTNPIYIAASFLGAITLISKISGGHINPVVSLAMYMNGSINMNQLTVYIPAQIVGAILAYFVFKNLFNKKSS